MPGRNYNADSYRYGWQSMENDDELKGTGNSLNTTFRQYDPRLGRWLSIDPKNSANESPYAGLGNNPVMKVDHPGDTAIWVNDQDAAKSGGHSALFFQNADGDWFFMTMGPAPKSDKLKINTAQDVNAYVKIKPLSNVNSKKIIKYINSNKSKYDEFVVLNTTKEQDQKIYRQAYKSKKDHNQKQFKYNPETNKYRLEDTKQYNLLFNNCATCAKDVLEKSGLEMPMMVDPRPNSYTEEVKEFGEEFNKEK